ncbi:MAG: hypothetical protein ACT4PV_13970 [Planctomycetaceae bacterium]
MDALPAALLAYAAGDAATQAALLDEVEPLLFGFLRSMTPSGPDAHERAVAAAHELLLAFDLMAARGRVELRDERALKSFCHRLAMKKLGVGGGGGGARAGLASLADPATGSLAARAPAFGALVRRTLDPVGEAMLLRLLLGDAPEEEAAFAPWRERLAGCGILRP